MKRSKLIFSICMLVAMCMSLAAVSYSWLRRDWRPSIDGDNIQIQTGSTLSIRLINGENVPRIVLGDLLHSPDDFRLKQVSNMTGRSEDFFKLEFQSGLSLENAVVQHIPVDDQLYANATERGEHFGYIEIPFFLVGNTTDSTYNQLVYIAPESHISIPKEVAESGDQDEIAKYEQALQAVRVSITIHGVKDEDGVDSTYGIKLDESTAHRGINNVQDHNGKYVVVGHSPLDESVDYSGENEESLNAPMVKNPDVAFRSLSYYSSALNGQEFDQEKALFPMSSSEVRRVTMRIWLEGTDDACTNDISGLNFDIAIVLAGYDVSNASGASTGSSEVTP